MDCDFEFDYKIKTAYPVVHLTIRISALRPTRASVESFVFYVQIRYFSHLQGDTYVLVRQNEAI